MDSAFLKFISQDNEDKITVLNTSLISLLLSAIVFSILLYSFASPISIIYLGIEEAYWISLCSIILFIDILSSRIMAYLRAMNRPVYFSLISIASVIVTIGANIYLITSLNMGIIGVLYGTMAGSLIRFILVLPLLITGLKFKFFEFNIYKKMLSFGIPFFPAALFFMIMEMADRYLLLQLVDVQTVGIYSIGYKMGSVLMFLISGFNLAWQPLFHKEQGNQNRLELFSTISTQFLVFMILVGSLISIWLPLIIQIPIGNGKTLIGEDFWGSVEIIPIIMLSYIFYAAYILQIPPLYDGNNQKWSPILRGLGAIINISLNLILIPKFGGVGAAIATLLAYLIMFLALFILNRKWLPISFNYGRILFLLVICILGYYYLQVEPHVQWQRFILSIIILSVGIPLLRGVYKNSIQNSLIQK
jgi:O-antigen/teichoic acid export membrane protein